MLVPFWLLAQGRLALRFELLLHPLPRTHERLDLRLKLGPPLLKSPNLVG